MSLIENKKHAYTYRELPLELVEVDEEAKVRAYYDVSDLVESIREVGQLAPGYAYKDGDKYKVFVGIRRLLAVKKLYEQEGELAVFKAFVFEKKPSNYYDLIREENIKRSDLKGLDKLHIIMKYAFANKLLSSRDARLIPLFKERMRDVPIQEVYELALVEQRAKAKGHDNHLSLQELLFLFRELRSLEERKLFATFFLVQNVHVSLFETGNFKQYAILNAPKLKPEELEIAGLGKEDVEKIIAMYKAPPYQAEIIKEEFEAKKEEPEEKIEKIEKEEVPSEISEEETIIIMDHDVEYEIINGQRFMLVKDESGIEPYSVKDGQELEIAGMKVKIKYGGGSA